MNEYLIPNAQLPGDEQSYGDAKVLTEHPRRGDAEAGIAYHGSTWYKEGGKWYAEGGGELPDGSAIRGTLEEWYRKAVDSE